MKYKTVRHEKSVNAIFTYLLHNKNVWAKPVCAKLFCKCGNLPETEEPVINLASFPRKGIPYAYSLLPPCRSGDSIYQEEAAFLFSPVLSSPFQT